MNPHFLRGGPFFTVAEVATFLHLSQSTVRRLAARGAIGSHRASAGRLLFSQAHVDAFLENTERPAFQNEGEDRHASRH